MSAPDMDIARKALDRGDRVTAEQHLVPLAEFGLLDAQLLLARFYEQELNPATLSKVESLYLSAAENGTVRAKLSLAKFYYARARPVDENGEFYSYRAAVLFLNSWSAGDNNSERYLIKLFDLYPDLLQKLLVGVQTGQSELETNRRLINYLLARNYLVTGQLNRKYEEMITLCDQGAHTLSACYEILGWVYAEYPLAGDLQILFQNIIRAKNLNLISIKQVFNIASTFSKPGSPLKITLIAQQLLQDIEHEFPASYALQANILLATPSLGTQADLVGLLREGRKAGDPKCQYLTGRIYFYGRRVALDPLKAEKHLLKVRHLYPGANRMLGEMYTKGYLGRADSVRGVRFLLEAARSGNIASDYYLAKYFWSGKGVVRNSRYAYSFASLADEAGHPGARELISEIRNTSTNEIIEGGSLLLVKERLMRSGLER